MTMPQPPSDYRDLYYVLAGLFIGYVQCLIAFIIAHWLHGRAKP